jgi:PhzF family phenazine biosynthesis protein
MTGVWIVDAFADRPFTGNPAAVVLLDGRRDAAWRQAVAEELNLSETAFVSARDDGAFDLSWFAPAAEVDLCGHATLATAHVLRETGRVDDRVPVAFHTRSGVLRATYAGAQIELDLPALAPRPVAASPELLAALGIATAVETLHHPAGYDVVVVEPATAVFSVAPDLAALRARGPGAVIVTAAGDVAGGDADFVSRYFAPGAGIAEDPVTGSGHCVLAPFWAARLGRSALVGHQLSTRGGRVACEPVGDRVRLRGTAVTVLRGELLA